MDWEFLGSPSGERVAGGNKINISEADFDLNLGDYKACFLLLTTP